jgi:hypothetical protein
VWIFSEDDGVLLVHNEFCDALPVWEERFDAPGARS